jgi:hypothetical protein
VAPRRRAGRASAAHSEPYGRAAIDPQGRATWVLTDYRVTLPEAAQSCVESALRSRPFALATLEGMTVTYAYAFADP